VLLANSSTKPFTQRRCPAYDYAMSDDERSLYDDVTEYSSSRRSWRSRRQRRLLLIGFHAAWLLDRPGAQS